MAAHALARAEVILDATDFDAAVAEAHDFVIPILSYWSHRYDVAIGVVGYHAEELRSSVQRLHFGFLGQVQQMDIEEGVRISCLESRLVLSAYREGVSASDRFYAVLSFARAVEGVRHLRAQRRQRLRDRDMPYRDPGERFPKSLDDLPTVELTQRDSFKPYLGRKFTDVMDNELRGPIRNAVAHLDPTQRVLSADRWADLARCEEVLPVLKYMAHVMIGNELQEDVAEHREGHPVGDADADPHVPDSRAPPAAEEP
jgi:hypothetical protein